MVFTLWCSGPHPKLIKTESLVGGPVGEGVCRISIFQVPWEILEVQSRTPDLEGAGWQTGPKATLA